ncbi:Crp/Fnr family transcriptional regulator [Methylorubrum sp. SB2]|uniref:Crp/Fnr family transcriptional regulator n=1 Tax=Methylorubrum subtropicum TaxID=3138812 RepID=UPI00313D38EF
MSDHNPLIRKLASLTQLAEGDKRLLEEITAHPVVVPAKKDLIREGDAPLGVFLVMDGLACRYKLLPNGARQVIGYLVPGDFCDLDVALLELMDHSIGTITQCRVVHIPSETVQGILDNHPRLARALRLAALVDAATAREWLVSVGRRTCEGRLAHLLCELHLRLRAVGRAACDSYELPLTQVDLADTTGMTTVHVNRTLRALRERGLIEGKGRHIRIRDAAELWVLAAFNPGYLHRVQAGGQR